MISRRLTKSQKTEILEAYRSGDNTSVLSEKYNCTINTINRTVKTLLSESEYSMLKKKRSKVGNKKLKEKQEGLEVLNNLISLKENVNEENQSFKSDKNLSNTEVDRISAFDQDVDTKDLEEIKEQSNDNFEEIPPLLSDFDFDLEKKKLDFEILNYESLPESVYMIVDKKVELDLQLISDLPEWSFLPENELERNAILLFTNQRSAKRSCSRNQRVIKIPNTSVFKISKSYLISKGVTRLILEDLIIALDN